MADSIGLPARLRDPSDFFPSIILIFNRPQQQHIRLLLPGFLHRILRWALEEEVVILEAVDLVDEGVLAEEEAEAEVVEEEGEQVDLVQTDDLTTHDLQTMMSKYN